MGKWKKARKTGNQDFIPENVKVGDRFRVVGRFKGNWVVDENGITEVELHEDDETPAPLFKDVNSDIHCYINWFRLKRVKQDKTKQNNKRKTK